MPSHSDLVFRALVELQVGLDPFVDKVLSGIGFRNWRKYYDRDRDPNNESDSSICLNALIDNWSAFSKLGEDEQIFRIAHSILFVRNRFSHPKPSNIKWFDANNTYFILSQIVWMLRAVGAVENARNVQELIDTSDLIFAARIPEEDGKLRSSDPEPLTIAGHLRRLGVSQDRIYRAARLHRHRLVIDDVISLAQLHGPGGLTAEMVRTSIGDPMPPLPAYVYDQWDATPEPANNGPLAFVTSWSLAPVDDGGTLTLELSRGDWHLQDAVRASAHRIREDVVRQGLPFLDTFPGFLSCAVTVETVADGRLLLLERSKSLRDEPGEWSVGIGENMRPDKDSTGSGGLHPVNTVKRGLREELGLDEEAAEASEITFLAIGMSVRNFSVGLYCHTCVPISSEAAIERAMVAAQDNEHRDYASCKWTLEKAIDLVVSGRDSPKRRQARTIASWSRLGLLLGSIAKFGVDAVQEKLASMAPGPRR